MLSAALICVLGLWLIVTPEAFGYADPARRLDLIAGTLLASLGFVALTEIMRPVRRAALPLGLWVAASVFLWGRPGVAAVSVAATGLAAAALALVRVPRSDDYGGGWRSLWHD